MWLEERETMTIKLNNTQSKLRSVGAPVGKRTLDSMILNTINHYAPATHSSGYSSIQGGAARHIEGEEYNPADLQGLLQGERVQSEPAAEEIAAPSMFEEFAAPEQQSSEAPAYETAHEFISETMQESAEQYDFEVPVDPGFAEFEASILPIQQNAEEP